MAVKLKVEIYEEEFGTYSEPQIFTAKTKVDHLPENDIIGRGYTPEEALDAWVGAIKEKEVFRPD